MDFCPQCEKAIDLNGELFCVWYTAYIKDIRACDYLNLGD